MNLFILIGATTLFGTIYYFQILKLKTRSYAFEKGELYRLDSVQMLSRAFTIGGPKSGTTWEFRDKKFRTFSISGSTNYDATKSKELYDTLQDSDLIMTIFTDKNGFVDYNDKKSKGKIKETQVPNSAAKPSNNIVKPK